MFNATFKINDLEDEKYIINFTQSSNKLSNFDIFIQFFLENMNETIEAGNLLDINITFLYDNKS